MVEKNKGTEDASGIKDQDGDIVVVLKREDVLSENTEKIEDIKERSMTDYYKALAGESHIVGFALSRIKMGGNVYMNFFVRDFKDDDAMRRVLDAIDEAERFLLPITGEEGLRGGFVPVGEKNPSEFANLFLEEFNSPPKYSPDSEEGMLNIFEVKGSNLELELCGVVMFE